MEYFRRRQVKPLAGRIGLTYSLVVVCTVSAPTTGKLILRINSKHLAPHFGSEVFLVALLLFGDHFFREMAAEAKIYMHAKLWASSLKIKGVMASDPKLRAKCLELVAR